MKIFTTVLNVLLVAFLHGQSGLIRLNITPLSDIRSHIVVQLKTDGDMYLADHNIVLYKYRGVRVREIYSNLHPDIYSPVSVRSEIRGDIEQLVLSSYLKDYNRSPDSPTPKETWIDLMSLIVDDFKNEDMFFTLANRETKSLAETTSTIMEHIGQYTLQYVEMQVDDTVYNLYNHSVRNVAVGSCVIASPNPTASYLVFNRMCRILDIDGRSVHGEFDTFFPTENLSKGWHVVRYINLTDNKEYFFKFIKI